jgi:hypothetical protein
MGMAGHYLTTTETGICLAVKSLNIPLLYEFLLLPPPPPHEAF